MVSLREGVERPEAADSEALLQVETDIATERRGVTADVHYPLGAGCGERFDDRTTRARSWRIEHDDGRRSLQIRENVLDSGTVEAHLTEIRERFPSVGDCSRRGFDGLHDPGRPDKVGEHSCENPDSAVEIPGRVVGSGSGPISDHL